MFGLGGGMADFGDAFAFVVSHEASKLSGELTHEPNGGLARFGVNSISNPEALADGFYEMPTDQTLKYAENVFVTRYWMPIMGGKITNQNVANRYADLAFNLGIREATLLFQRAANSICSSSQEIVCDGVPGPATVYLVNGIDPSQLLGHFERAPDCRGCAGEPPGVHIPSRHVLTPPRV
jgi:lysozyme family protein